MRPHIKDIGTMLAITAKEWAAALEDRERDKSGTSLPVARKAVAARLRVSPGTLENLRRGRLKDIKLGLFESLRQAVIHEAQREIRLLEHTIEMARAADGNAAVEQVSSLESQRDALRKAIDE